MSEDTGDPDGTDDRTDRPIHRRHLLAGVGAGGLAGLAGCLGTVEREYESDTVSVPDETASEYGYRSDPTITRNRAELQRNVGVASLNATITSHTLEYQYEGRRASRRDVETSETPAPTDTPTPTTTPTPTPTRTETPTATAPPPTRRRRPTPHHPPRRPGTLRRRPTRRHLLRHRRRPPTGTSSPRGPSRRRSRSLLPEAAARSRRCR